MTKWNSLSPPPMPQSSLHVATPCTITKPPWEPYLPADCNVTLIQPLDAFSGSEFFILVNFSLFLVKFAGTIFQLEFVSQNWYVLSSNFFRFVPIALAWYICYSLAKPHTSKMDPTCNTDIPGNNVTLLLQIPWIIVNHHRQSSASFCWHKTSSMQTNLLAHLLIFLLSVSPSKKL